MKVVFKFFLFVIICIQQQIIGYEVSPSRGTIVVEKNKSHTLFILGNHITKPIGIEVCAKNWTMDSHGDQDYSEMTDDLQIFPSSFILVPGKKQKVKVTYKGKKPLEQEKTYRVIVDEVRLDHETPEEELSETDDDSGPKFAINLSKRYVTSLFVTSKSFKDDVRALFKVYPNENQQPTLALHLKNYGLQSKRVKNYSLKVKSDNKQLQEALNQISPPSVYLFSKGERSIEFLLPEALNLQDLDPSAFSLHFKPID